MMHDKMDYFFVH